MEGYANAGTLNGSGGNSAPVGGRRHRHHKGSKKVSARTIRATLRRLHLRPKGRVVLKGGEGEAAAEGMEGGRRHRHRHSHKRTHRHRKFLGMF